MPMKVFISKDKSRKFVFFYGSASAFSNFHPTEFSAKPLESFVKSGNSTELQFNCSEQYFMYHKALLIGDHEIAEKILKETDPKEMKRLGRILEMSQKQLEEWSQKSRDVMYHACLEKFSQNPECLKFLFKTHGMNLVEASPTDKIWGIGLGQNDKRCEDPKNWRGSNWLGIVLDKVREELWERNEFNAERAKIEKEDLEKRCEFLRMN